ncbi:DNA polymerase III subunit epsilon [invertebrate metagenome]|uniref:DNA polymerase III subunit epsilon n=1 Tax=invertebrate metagenome TaxID=1711999 RepID=A0A2H9T748_9ZZZZ
MRQIVLDTETTGIDPRKGHRIIEIGCVEMIDRKLTGNHYHVYINPQRAVEEEAVKIHGITNDYLADKPLFLDVADEFMNFVSGADLIIHNAPFDVGFINHELRMFDKEIAPVETVCAIIDTLVLARKKHPGQKNNLDTLCKRYGIDNSSRTLHGALLDAEILADVYLIMTGGQTSLVWNEISGKQAGNKGKENVIHRLSQKRPTLKVVSASAEETKQHDEFLINIQKKSGKCLWE